MIPYYAEPRAVLYHGECVEIMRSFDAESFDAVVTDPPYGLEFMGKEWDGAKGFASSLATAGMSKPGIGERATAWPSHFGGLNPRCRSCGHSQRGGSPCTCASPDFPNERGNRSALFQAWCEAWAVEALRVLKPGGHLVAFGGTRTYHRLTSALEDAGFEIRDCLMWLYGSGFPKSLDVSKAIDKAAGASRPVIGREVVDVGMQGGHMHTGRRVERVERDVTGPATDEAIRWQGWGTALKPAWEPIVLARKPLAERNVAANVLVHGTGAINVDACRIGTDETWDGGGPTKPREGGIGFASSSSSSSHPRGRWPANLVLDEDAAALLDAQSGELTSGKGDRLHRNTDKFRGVYSPYAGNQMAEGALYGDSGGASRFFYTSKADREDRDGSKHPTVKPVDLMKWLVTLVTPPGGTILDPFMGSGTTIYAARELGFRVVGIDRDEPSVRDAIHRLRQGMLL